MITTSRLGYSFGGESYPVSIKRPAEYYPKISCATLEEYPPCRTGAERNIRSDAAKKVKPAGYVQLAIDVVKEALMAKVVLFSTSACSWCRRAKRYFREQRVPFKEVNLERDPEAARDVVRKTGQTGVPVIKIGNRWIVGFDKERIEKELGLT